MGCKAAPIKMDSKGISVESLEKTLSDWPKTGAGGKRPHLYVKLS
jgi:DNA-binding transcriptional MocR family regulator